MKKGDQFIHQFVITKELYSGFINLFKDANPLHADSSFAIKYGFDSVVMHGNILNGFLSYFVGECLPIKNVLIHAQSIKYHKPVYLNDQLELKSEITDYFESVKAYEIKFTFTNSNGIKVANGSIQIGILN